MKNYKVSIIIPVYNGSNYVREAIDSALAQTYQNKEILVINDGSTDGGETEKIAKRYGAKIRYFKKKNGGVATALNFGLKKMTGEYFSWLSHDDLYKPNKIAAEIEMAKKSSPKTIIYCDMDIIDGSGRYIRSIRLKPVKKSIFAGELVKHNFLHGCGLLIPRSAFEDAGLFKPELRHTQDYDLWFRMFKAGYNFKLCPEVLIAGRQHMGQDSLKGNDAAIVEKDNLYNHVLLEFSKSEFFLPTESASLGYIKMAIHSKMLNLDRSAQTAYQLSRKYLRFKEYLNWSFYQISYLLWSKLATKAFYKLVQIVRRFKRRQVAGKSLAKSDKIKICFISNINAPHNKKILGLLIKEKDFDIYFITTRAGTFPGVKVYFAGPKKFEPIFCWFIRFLFLAKKLVHQIKPDIVHGQSLTAGGIASYFSGFKPYIASAWGTDVMGYSPNLIIRKLVQKTIHNAAATTGSSMALRDAVLALGGDRKKFSLIRFGIDLDIFKPKKTKLREELGIKKRMMIFCPRSIGPIYNNLVLLQAFKIVSEKVDAVLVQMNLVDDQKYFKEMLDYIKQNALEKKVIFVSEVTNKEIANYYNASDIVVSVPKWDGAGVSLVEALATGKKIVVTKLPNLRDWSKAKYWSCPINDVNQTAKQIISALNFSNQEFKPLAQKNRKLITAKGEVKQNFQKLIDLYQKLVLSEYKDKLSR